MKPATRLQSITLSLGTAWVFSLAAPAIAQDSQPLSDSDMQQMLNQMNSWKQPQQGGFGQPMGGGGYGMQQQMPQQMPMGGGYGMQQPMQQMPPMQPPMQQMPMNQFQPLNQYQQMPPMQGMPTQPMNMNQLPPMQGMQTQPMGMQQLPPMQGMQTQAMNSFNQMGGAPQMPPLQGMATQQAGVGSKFNLGNLFGKPLVGPGGMGNIFRQMAALNQAGSGGSGSANARDAIEYELSRAKSMAAQAVAYMDDARSASHRDSKQSAASESRYYANEARAAADRAASRLSECPDAAGLVSAARAEANRAYSASQYAADAASGW